MWNVYTWPALSWLWNSRFKFVNQNIRLKFEYPCKRTLLICYADTVIQWYSSINKRITWSLNDKFKKKTFHDNLASFWAVCRTKLFVSFWFVSVMLLFFSRCRLGWMPYLPCQFTILTYLRMPQRSTFFAFQLVSWDQMIARFSASVWWRFVSNLMLTLSIWMSSTPFFTRRSCERVRTFLDGDVSIS